MRKAINSLRRYILCLGMILLAATAVVAKGRVWETVDSNPPRSALASDSFADDPSQIPEGFDPESAGIDISVRDGFIYLSTPRELEVKIFTILGQPVSVATLKPGVHRIALGSRGIFIVKAASLTRRVTL